MQRAFHQGRFSLDEAKAGRTPRAENRFGLDYTVAAGLLRRPVCPIIDAHTHLNGSAALELYRRAAALFGVQRALTMVRLAEAARVREVLGDMVSFIAFPDFRDADRYKAFTAGFLTDIRAFHDQFGARMIKLWNAPRLYDFFSGEQARETIPFDSPWRIQHIKLAQKLGMGIMVHVADPDTWFASRYSDSSKYLHKRAHYESLERVMRDFEGPWLGAHMGGSPEDLEFLDGLLSRHPNFSIDTSATKWIVRELSKHRKEDVAKFFRKWEKRIIFGSDIVTTDEHLAPKPAPINGEQKAGAPGFNASKPGVTRHPMADLAGDPQEAFDLYASRYLALRMLLETDYNDESPIADPDLAMVDPKVTDPLAAPRLRGAALPDDTQGHLYRANAVAFFGRMGLML